MVRNSFLSKNEEQKVVSCKMFHAVPAIDFKKTPRSEPQCVQRRCVAVVIHYCAAPSLSSARK